MKTFFRLVRIAFWRGLEHDQFAVAKAAAFSAILTLFPAVLLIASILTTSHSTAAFVNEIQYALGRILPAGTKQAVLQYFQRNKPRPIGRLVVMAIITLWTASGVMISWMEGFRKAYHLPKIWGIVRERVVSFMLVVMAGVPMAFASFLVAFGNQIERWMVFHAGHELAGYILGIWTAVRWIISTLTSIAVIALIYHHGLPRTQPWHRVLPGAVFATVMWFVATVFFGTYLRHFANYNEIYGSLASAIALLIWLYLVSLVVLVGAEFNALRYPRYLFGARSDISLAEPLEENGR
jgi:membrane protein